MSMANHRDLRRDEQGAAIIEMALSAPILALLLIGMVDLSRGYSTKLQLEQVAQRTVEKIQNTDYAETQKTALQTEAAAVAGVAASAVTVESWLECNNTGARLAFTASCPNADDPFARYVEVRILKSYTPMFKSRYAGVQANGTYTLQGKAGVRVQ